MARALMAGAPAGAPATERAVIAIDGIDGSGKSMLADRLVAALAEAGVPAALLHVDDFRRPVDWTRTDRDEPDLYYDEYYDLALLDRCLQGFVRGEAQAEIPHFDSARERMDGTRTLGWGGAAVAIVEGVFVLRVPTVRTQATVVLVEIDAALARRRLMARDVAIKGRAPEEVRRRIDQRYFPAQERYRAAFDPAASAALIIDNQMPEAPRATKLALDRVPARLAGVLMRIAGPAT